MMGFILLHRLIRSLGAESSRRRIFMKCTLIFLQLILACEICFSSMPNEKPRRKGGGCSLEHWYTVTLQNRVLWAPASQKFLLIEVAHSFAWKMATRTVCTHIDVVSGVLYFLSKTESFWCVRRRGRWESILCTCFKWSDADERYEHQFFHEALHFSKVSENYHPFLIIFVKWL